MKTATSFLAPLLLLAQAAQAHPTGHDGGFFENVSHFLTQPDHLVGIAVALCAIAAICFYRIKAAKK